MTILLDILMIADRVVKPQLVLSPILLLCIWPVHIIVQDSWSLLWYAP